MSAYITLVTPMLDEECLVAAIVDQGFREASIVGAADTLVVPERRVSFHEHPTGYVATFSPYAQADQGWLSRVSARDRVHWTAKQERLAAEERRRLEEGRQRPVEGQRRAVHERARRMGDRVQETREGDRIRMVLVKRTN